MKILTHYECEHCQDQFADAHVCEDHEELCRLAGALEVELADPPFHKDGRDNPANPWNPPPIREMREWTRGDREELARRIRRVFKLLQSMEQAKATAKQFAMK